MPIWVYIRIISDVFLCVEERLKSAAAISRPLE